MLCSVLLQVLHLCSVVMPNFDCAFALMMVWAVPQLAGSSFFVRYSLVSL
jgi:hypothetical protein